MIETSEGNFAKVPADRNHRVEWTTPDEPATWPAVSYAGKA